MIPVCSDLQGEHVQRNELDKIELAFWKREYTLLFGRLSMSK